LKKKGTQIMESSKLLLEKALKLRPQERILLLEGLLHSLDEPDKDLDTIWSNEVKKRLNAYRNGKIKGVKYGDIFGE
jgi:putative addiction module component (TIGR02574 family)